jgi:hypothetical protein
MKTLQTPPLSALLALVALSLAACTTPTAPAPATDGRVTVGFHEPDKFTDAADGSFGGYSQRVLDELGDFLRQEAGRRLGAGETLKITFTDVDLAGDFEPWRRSPGGRDIRIVKAVYPPRFAFSYVHTGADGTVLRQGGEHLTDLAFQIRINLPRNDTLFYEKELLRDWLGKVLRK